MLSYATQNGVVFKHSPPVDTAVLQAALEEAGVRFVRLYQFGQKSSVEEGSLYDALVLVQRYMQFVPEEAFHPAKVSFGATGCCSQEGLYLLGAPDGTGKRQVVVKDGWRSFQYLLYPGFLPGEAYLGSTSTSTSPCGEVKITFYNEAVHALKNMMRSSFKPAVYKKNFKQQVKNIGAFIKDLESTFMGGPRVEATFSPAQDISSLLQTFKERMEGLAWLRDVVPEASWDGRVFVAKDVYVRYLKDKYELLKAELAAVDERTTGSRTSEDEKRAYLDMLRIMGAVPPAQDFKGVRASSATSLDTWYMSPFRGGQAGGIDGSDGHLDPLLTDSDESSASEAGLGSLAVLVRRQVRVYVKRSGGAAQATTYRFCRRSSGNGGGGMSKGYSTSEDAFNAVLELYGDGFEKQVVLRQPFNRQYLASLKK